MNSLEAMKNAAYSINAVIRKEKTATVEIINLHIAACQLDKAIAAEEAQGVDPTDFEHWINSRRDHKVSEVFHEIVSKFTCPATPADHIGDATKLVAQRPINCGTGHCSFVECVMPGNHVEDVLTMVPMTDGDIDLLSMGRFGCVSSDAKSFARSIEAHHGIGLKP